MTRPRHAMRPHPLRSPGVLVGVPVAAAVAFGAHAVLGVVPVADEGAPPTSSAPSAAPAAPVQGYGLATAPPPTTLGLLSAPGADPGTSTGNGASTVPIAGSSTAAHHAGVPARTVPVTHAAAAPAPSLMTFSGAHAAAVPAASARAAAPAPAAAPAAAPQVAAPQAVERAAPAAAPAPQGGGSSDQGASAGSPASLDLGVAKVSLLSFGD